MCLLSPQVSSLRFNGLIVSVSTVFSRSRRIAVGCTIVLILTAFPYKICIIISPQYEIDKCKDRFLVILYSVISFAPLLFWEVENLQ